MCVITDKAKIFIPMNELVDFEAERKRLTKELEDVERKLASINAKLSNEGFLAKAPQKVIDEQKESLARFSEKAALLRESIAKLGA